MGKLIVIDGLDGSGKSTQAELIYEYYKSKTEKVMLISFPDYAKDSSALVRMYLNGELSDNLEDINAYAASSFYAVDRYASFKTEWEKQYNDGYLIIASRYVSSNAIHQMVKLPQKEWNQYITWLQNYEYNLLKLPKPNKVIFLRMERSAADKLLLQRYNGDIKKLDIHEKNHNYLLECEKSSSFAIEAMGFQVIECCNGEVVLPIDVITKKIITELEKCLNFEN